MDAIPFTLVNDTFWLLAVFSGVKKEDRGKYGIACLAVASHPLHQEGRGSYPMFSIKSPTFPHFTFPLFTTSLLRDSA